MRPWTIGFVAKMRTQLAALRHRGTSSRDPAGIDIEGILKNVDEVEKQWELVEAALADAEEREIREQLVREWLHQLRDLCYDMEDVSDLFEYQLIASEVKTDGTSNQVPPLENPSFWNDIQYRVRKIKQGFENIAKNKKELQLKEAVVVGTRSDKVSGSMTGSYPVGKLLGRNGEFAELSKLLLKAEGVDNSNNVEVITLVGRGGVGKTFLAQHIFQDLEKSAHFDIKGWVYVSQDFDLVTITKDVLEAFTWKACENRQLDILQKRICGFIEGKKFFLVMDNVPNLQVDQWERFFSVFVYNSVAKMGSKIVITSREDGVFGTVGATSIKLGCLTEEDGWSLLQYHAFANSKAEHPGELESIGREIVRKCNCLPSAIKKHGQLLCRNGGDDEDAWRRILEAGDLLQESVQDDASNKGSDGASGSSIITSSRAPTGSFPSEKKLVGRDVEIDRLVNLIKEEEGGSSNVEVIPIVGMGDSDVQAVSLIKEDGGSSDVQTIAIVGMGGSGKTSLAQHVFQKLKEDKHFDVTGWVFVSDVFDLVGITKAVLNAVTGQNHENNDLNWLQYELCIYIKEKKFFLVMDDMWNTDVNIWSSFVAPFMHTEVRRGSKILITAREVKVAQTADVVDANCIKLKSLQTEDAWSLFQHHAFGKPIDEAQYYLEDLGRDVVRKCAGLPLAIKVLGSCLRNETDMKHWINILESNWWDSIQVEGEPGKQILGPLYMSYLRLPPHLKACFRYCNFFHRNKDIKRKDLIRLWVAHNLIRDDNLSGIYGKADVYIDELVSRSLLEYPYASVKSSMRIHDLLFDMLQYISGRDFNVMQKELELLSHARHVHFNDCQVQWISPPHVRRAPAFLLLLSRASRRLRPNTNEIFANGKRTLWVSHLKGYKAVEVHEGNALRSLSMEKIHISNLDSCLADSRLLRMLVLNECGITQLPTSLFRLYNLRELILACASIKVLPNSIGNLKNLIKLDISFTEVEMLPEVVCGLTNLCDLNLSYSRIVKLPESLQELTNLEVLLLRECTSLRTLPGVFTRLTRLQSLDISSSGISFMPRGFSSLTRLHYLSDFYVGKVEDGHAGIGELKTWLAAYPGQKLQIHGLQNVTRKEAELYPGPIFSRNKHLHKLGLYWDELVDDSQIVLEALRPQMQIEELTIENYNGSTFQTWTGIVPTIDISGVVLRKCENCISVSSLGQIPCLESLRLHDMASLRELVLPQEHGLGCSTSFQKLTELRIYKCKSLISIPLYRFPSLISFTIESCYGLTNIEFVDPSHEATSTSILEVLRIYDCRQLQSLHMLPRSFKKLEVKKCKILGKWIKDNRFSTLAQVDFIELDRYTILDAAPGRDAVRLPMAIKLLTKALANAPTDQQKIMLRKSLYPLVYELEDDMAANVTEMLLEMKQTEVLHLLESPDALKSKVAEAMEILRTLVQQQKQQSCCIH